MCQKGLKSDLGIKVDNIQLLKHTFNVFLHIKNAIYTINTTNINFKIININPIDNLITYETTNANNIINDNFLVFKNQEILSFEYCGISFP